MSDIADFPRKWVAWFNRDKDGTITAAGIDSECRTVGIAEITVENVELDGPNLNKLIEGDAYLMAAAPDLLEACEKVLSKLDYLANLWGGEGVTRAISDQIRAAVTKAKGLTP